MSMPLLKPIFLRPDPAHRNRRGLPLTDFVRVLFVQLYREHEQLKVPKEATHLVALLHELFFQIGKNLVDGHKMAIADIQNTSFTRT